MNEIRNWTYLAWTDILARYRRSRLGVFWITLASGISITTIGYAYSELFKQPIKTYLPFIALGIVFWQYIANSLNELTVGLTSNRSLLLSSSISPAWISYRIVLRNFFILLHSLIIVIPLCVYLSDVTLYGFWIFIVALILVTFNIWAWGTSLALISIRIGDVPQLVTALLGVLFLVTPVLWDVSVIGTARIYFFDMNPFAHALELLRAPLLGKMPDGSSFIWMIMLAIIGYVASLLSLKYFRLKFIVWL